jgi:tRNA(fMet)-specific endonuclease VapC
MTRWLLDTNTVSYFIRDTLKNAPIAAQRPENLCISVITEAELLFGLRWRPGARRVNDMVVSFIGGIEVLPFDSTAAESYGVLRAEMQRVGKSLAALDMLIAAHALSRGATLVTSDAAFGHVPALSVEDWS